MMINDGREELFFREKRIDPYCVEKSKRSKFLLVYTFFSVEKDCDC
jgi:hypothetical protein